jgi:DNA-binding CsgD family transcriptional regulator
MARARAIGAGEGSGPARATRQDRAMQALCEAEWTRVQGSHDDAAWTAVLDAWSTSEPHECAYARFRQAEALIAAGTKDDGVTVLRHAFSEATALGAGPLLAQIEALARRARIRLATGSPVAGAPASRNGTVLTRRETDVLALVAAGHSNREIADALFMSEKTASVHVSRILTKLGVSNRAQAAVIGHRLRLLPDDEG